MLRIAVPYGELSSVQLRVLAAIAREYDQPDAELLHEAQDKQLALGPVPVPGGGRRWSPS
jgi:sulfite reductase (NADPH) hemoprotein beta-component